MTMKSKFTIIWWSKWPVSVKTDYSLGEPTESKILKITRTPPQKKNWTSDRYLMVCCCCYSDTCKIFQLTNSESLYLSYWERAKSKKERSFFRSLSHTYRNKYIYHWLSFSKSWTVNVSKIWGGVINNFHFSFSTLFFKK